MHAQHQSDDLDGHAKRPCVTFALDASGRSVSIAEVPSGLECNCTCVGCGAQVIARKGQLRAHHFAHANGSECVGAYESALHLAVKTVLERRHELLLPKCIVTSWRKSSTCPDDNSSVCTYVARDPRTLYKSPAEFDRAYATCGVGFSAPCRVQFDRVAVEQIEGSIRPDVIGYIKGIPIYIEVTVTNAVSQEKLERLRARGVSTLELDFSAHAHTLWTWKDIERRLLEDVVGKRWLLNRRAEELAGIDRSAREQRTRHYRAELEKNRFTHHSIFGTGHESVIAVMLSQNHVVVTRAGNMPFKGDHRIFEEDMLDFGGKYDQRSQQWRFYPPTEERFIELAKTLRRRYAGKYDFKWKMTVPSGEEDRIRRLLDGSGT